MLPVRVLLVLVNVNSENKARHYSVNLVWEYSDYWKSFDSMTVMENMKSMKYLDVMTFTNLIFPLILTILSPV